MGGRTRNVFGHLWVIFRYKFQEPDIPIDLDAATKNFPCSKTQNFRMRFEYWKTEDGQWTWELKTSIGDVIARGGSHPTREHCLTAMRLVKLAAGAKSIEVTVRRDELVPLQPVHLA